MIEKIEAVSATRGPAFWDVTYTVDEDGAFVYDVRFSLPGVVAINGSSDLTGRKFTVESWNEFMRSFIPLPG